MILIMTKSCRIEEIRGITVQRVGKTWGGIYAWTNNPDEPTICLTPQYNKPLNDIPSPNPSIGGDIPYPSNPLALLKDTKEMAMTNKVKELWKDIKEKVAKGKPISIPI